MSDFDVTVDRRGGALKAATTLRFFGFDARHLAKFAGAYTAFVYIVCFTSVGFDRPIELLYPAALSILALALMPGVCITVAFFEIVGWSQDLSATRLVVIVLISAAIYGFEVRRGLRNRNGQAPYSSAAD